MADYHTKMSEKYIKKTSKMMDELNALLETVSKKQKNLKKWLEDGELTAFDENEPDTGIDEVFGNIQSAVTALNVCGNQLADAINHLEDAKNQ